MIHIERKLTRFLESLAGSSVAELRIASAFVTVAGVRAVREATVDMTPAPTVQLIAGLDDCVTQPEALTTAIDHGFDVRIMPPLSSKLFHPKLLWALARAGGGGSAYIGSANLTGRGLDANDEMGVVVAYPAEEPSELHAVWAEWVDRSVVATDARIREYEAAYAALSARRADLPPVALTLGGSRAIAFRGALRGKARSSLQASGTLGAFFGIGAPGEPIEIHVAFGKIRKPARVVLHHDGSTLQLNFGRHGLHHELGPVLDESSLLLLTETSALHFRAEVVSIDSPRGESIIRRAGGSPDTFFAGVVVE